MMNNTQTTDDNKLSNEKIAQMGNEYVMNTYGQSPICFSHGQGMYLFDNDGNRYLDFVGGIATNCLGYGDEDLSNAIAKQAKELIHISNLYWNEPNVKLAKSLVELSGLDKVFFCNSGAESIEAALKLAKTYGNLYKNASTKVISMKNSFHGRTYGAITLTGQLKYQNDIGPLLENIDYAEFNNIDSIESAIDDSICGILIEVIQGEGGINNADEEFIKSIRKICDDKDILMIIDEVQTGVGRTGKFFAYEHYGIKPDIVVTAKGLGGGVPIGVMIANDKAAKAFTPGKHASTFGGNPLSSTAGNTVIDKLINKGLLASVETTGQYLKASLEKLMEKKDTIIAVKGMGLIQGIQMTIPLSDVTTKALERGVLLVGAGSDVIRFVPPLIVKKEHIDLLIDVLDDILD